MSKVIRFATVIATSLLLSSAALAQAPAMPKPGPEHEKLKELEGTWDAVMKMGGAETKAVATYKMDLGGMWLTSDFQGEVAGQKFTGRGFDGYDANKKKYVSVWLDSMSPSPMFSEGNYDAAGKVQTMTGEGQEAGKTVKFKMTTEHKDKDNFVFTMYGAGPDGMEMAFFSITYTRRK